MVAANFEASLAAVLKFEGGNDDDPEDHGGRTSRGITQREYNAWRREHGQPPEDVWKAPQSDIEMIYKKEYWTPWGDVFPVGIDFLYFDMAVNAGPYRATVLLQRALGVNDDGRIGPVTRGAVAAADPKVLAANYTERRKQFYRGLHQPRFIKGWINRANQAWEIALAMIDPPKAAT